MKEVTLSPQNRIVIPAEARNALKLKPGDKLLFVIRSDRVIILKRPKSYTAAIRGPAGQKYPKAYLKEERKSWG